MFIKPGKYDFTFSKSKIAFSCLLLVWSLVILQNSQIYKRLIAEGIPGYPNSEQFDLYILLPIIMCAVNVCLVAYPKKTNILLLIILFMGEIIALMISIALEGGGV